MEDRRLIHQCQRRDREALRRLYLKYRDVLFKVAVSLLRDTGAAEDAVQDVFVRFAENIDRFRLTGSLKAYLSVCVANQCRNVLVSQIRRCAVERRPGDAESMAGPETQIVCNEEMELLAEAMQQLPFEQRQIITLRHYGELRFGVIARSLQISPNTAKSRYRYGMEKMRAILKDKIE